MKSVGEFIFRGIEKRDGGKFINDKGQEIEYDAKYVLKVDEIGSDGSINERKLNVDIKNTSLVDKLKQLKPYEKIKIECDIVMYQNTAKVVPVAISDSNNK